MIFFLGLSLFSKSQDIKFEHFNTAEGLSNASVRSIYQDKTGFLWFGTLNGLNRYDGRKIKVFNYNTGNDKTIGNNRISQIYQDQYDYIWILTYDNKVHRFNTQTDKFDNLPFDVYAQHKLLAHNFIQETSPGVLWFLLMNGGCGRVITSSESTFFKIDIYNPDNTFTGKEINFLHFDKNKHVWIGTSKGLFLLPEDTVNFTNGSIQSYFGNFNLTAACEVENEIIFGTEQDGILFYNLTDNLFSDTEFNRYLIKTRITAIEKNSNGDVLIGTLSRGLVYYNSSNRNTLIFNKISNGLKSLKIEGIYPDSYNKFWIATDKRGITFFDPVLPQFRHFDLNQAFRESNYEGEKHVIFEDSNNDLWLGIHGGGLFHFNRPEMDFDHYCHDEEKSSSLSSNYILSVFEDRSNNLWIGTRAGGLNKLNLKNQPFFRIQPFAKIPNSNNNEIRALCEDLHGNIWIGSKTGELICYSDVMNLNSSLPEINAEIKKLNLSGIYALYCDRSGNIWIGTKGDGIFVLNNMKLSKGKYSISNTEIIRFQNNPLNSNSLSSNNVYSIIEDTLNRIWIGTYQGGVNLLTDPWGSPQFQHFAANEKNPGSLSDNRVRYLYFDRGNNLWIGTVNGLNFLSKEHVYGLEKTFVKFINNQEERSGLSYNDVICIYEDSKNEIWIGTFGGGLNSIKRNIGNDTVFEWQNYVDAENYSKNVIYSVLEDNNKNIWLSTDYGLRKLYSSNLNFENFNIEETIGSGFFSECGSLKTSRGMIIYGHKSGILYFSPDSVQRINKDYPIVITAFNINDEPSQINMNKGKSVRLKHFQNFLSFNFAILDYTKPDNIQYAYILENYDTKWNYVQNQAYASYKNLKPGRYTFIVKGTNSYGNWITSKAELAINIVKPFYKTYFAYLIYFLIFASLVFFIVKLWMNDFKLRNKIDLEEKITENKLKFYTSISHELKTPLTLILGTTEKLYKEKHSKDDKGVLVGLIRRNSLKLLNLIDQLLDFRKIQKDRMDLKVRMTELIGYVNDIYTLFVPMAVKREIQFKHSCTHHEYTGWIDTNFVEKIFFNLLSNAFKFTSPGKTIKLSILIDEENHLLTIAVQDEGKGIDEKDLPRIFERFNSLAVTGISGDTGTGIGLSLTKELVEIHKGKIDVESKIGIGTTFTVSVPVNKSIYLPEEIIEDTSEMDYLAYTEKNIEILDTSPELKFRDAEEFNKNYCIMVVEDNTELRNFITCTLSSKYLVIEASGGVTALNIACSNMPDLIICDLMIPEMDGLELCKQLKNNYSTSHIPVIMLTAISSVDQKIKSIEFGADDYITKPFSMEYLEKRIENIILQRKKLKEKFSKDPKMIPEKLGLSSHDQKLLEDIIQIIEKNISEPDYSIDKVASQIGFGRTVFYKKIKALTGCTPHDFIKIIRMKNAAILLSQGKSVTTVSYDVGFLDVEYFSKNFKKYFGETPSEYQRNIALYAQ